jgi:hypothetical protein
MKCSVYASPEMSHFLLGSSRWWADDIRDALKAPGFLRPCIEAFLLYDQIVLAPGVHLDDNPIDETAAWGDILCELVDQQAIVQAPLTQTDYEEIKHQSLDDLVKCIKLLPPQSLSHWASRFHYDYLLESPWWRFVREIDLATSDAINELQSIRPDHGPSIRGLIPFLFSTIFSLKANHLLQMPSLLSQVEYAIREDLLEVGLIRTLRSGFPTPALTRLRSIVRDTSEKFAVSIPSFYDICSAQSTSRLDILRNAVRLRSDPDCKWFRKQFWSVVGESAVHQTTDQRWKQEVDEISEKLVRYTKGRFRGRLRRILVDIRQCGPICYLLASHPVNALVEKLGSFLLSQAGQSRRRRELGWRCFLLRYAEAPPTSIGTFPSVGKAFPTSYQEAFWNSVEEASLARLIVPTSPKVEAIVDHIRENVGSGVWRLTAEELGEQLYEQLQQKGIAYDYEPFSPAIPQRVRLPDFVLSSQNKLSVATCLELALLFASVIEAGHSHPLLFHLVHQSGDAHALAGYWRKAPQDELVVLSGDSARKWLMSQEMTAIETTGLCSDKDLRCSFTEAKQRAQEIIDDVSWSLHFTLNVFASREHGLLPITGEKKTNR